MIDINTIIAQAINNAIATAVDEATTPLVERIAALENVVAEYGVTAPIVARLNALDAALAARPAVQIDAAAAVEALNTQEWFWEKIERFVQTPIANAIGAHENNAPHIGHNVLEAKIDEAIDEHLQKATHFDDYDIDTKIEEAIEKHEENKAHGDEDDIEELVEKMLRNASISISL